MDSITTTTYGTGQQPGRARVDARPGSFLGQALGAFAANVRSIGDACPTTTINGVWTMVDKHSARHLGEILT
jgi:hypothetical protein